MHTHLKTAAASAFLFVTALPVQAQLFQNLESAGGAGFGESQPRSVGQTVGSIINVFLGVLGILAVALIVYAGFLWMTAQGNEERVEKARNILTQAVIGLVIILASYGIARFVTSALTRATGL